MPSRFTATISTLTLLLASGAALASETIDKPFDPANAWESVMLGPDIRMHDPSRIVKEGDRYYVIVTGKGLPLMQTDELDGDAPFDPSTFHRAGAIFQTFPDWITDVAADQKGVFWAPDLIRWGEGEDAVWRLYYSVSSMGKQTSALALAESPTIDPATAKWEDKGIVIQTYGGERYNAIDPGLIADDDGSLWMVFGSWWKGIQIVELDPETGKVLNPDEEPKGIAQNVGEGSHNEGIEASEIYKHDGWYYLFVNWGTCCSGTNSSYEIRVGRSKDITGPYLDKEGKSLSDKGGSPFMQRSGRFFGPGHVAVLETDNGPVFSIHYYDGDKEGSPRLAVLPLNFDKEGWPVAGTVED